MPRQNLGDRPLFAALVRLQDDAVTNSQLLALLALLLEPSAQRRFVCLSRFRADMPDAAGALQHDAFLPDQELPSWRIASHQGSGSARLDVIS